MSLFLIATRRLCLAVALILAMSGCAPHISEPANVILVIVDTLRADHLAAYGYHRASTPRLDALFDTGILFESARSNAACTYPSVNSLLTSRHPIVFISRAEIPEAEVGLEERRAMKKLWQAPRAPAKFGIPEDIPSLPEILRGAGYQTLAVSSSPIVRDKPGQATNKWGGFGRGFDVFDEECLMEDAECVNQKALSMLDDRAAEMPFLLYLHYMEPHGPYRPPESHEREYALSERKLSHINAGNPNPLKKLLIAAGEDTTVIDRGDLAHLIDLYDEEIAYFDSKFSEMLDALEERGLLDNSLLVLTSDHGEAFAEHGVMTHCYKVYDPEVRVPMFMRFPDSRIAKVVQQPVQNLDLVPTILDYLDITYDETQFDGVSILSAIEGREKGLVRPVFSSQRGFRSVTSGQYKLVMDLVTGTVELFDLAADPDEQENLASVERERARELRRTLVRFLRQTEGGVGSEEALSKGRAVESALKGLGYLE